MPSKDPLTGSWMCHDIEMLILESESFVSNCLIWAWASQRLNDLRQLTRPLGFGMIYEKNYNENLPIAEDYMEDLTNQLR